MPNIEPLCTKCPFRDVTLYAPLPDDQIAALRSPKSVREVPAKGMIHREGEVPDELYSLREGWAFRFKLLPNGRRQILSLLLPGDFITLQGLLRQPLWFSVQAVTPATLCAFGANTFARKIATSEILFRRVEQSCLEESMAMDERVIDLGRRSAVERMARLMLEIHMRLERRGVIGEDGSFPFFLRQEHLADALGLTPVHVSRTLGELRNLDLIALESQRLTVKDRARLGEIAGVADRDLAQAWTATEPPDA